MKAPHDNGDLAGPLAGRAPDAGFSVGDLLECSSDEDRPTTRSP